MRLPSGIRYGDLRTYSLNIISRTLAGNMLTIATFCGTGVSSRSFLWFILVSRIKHLPCGKEVRSDLFPYFSEN